MPAVKMVPIKDEDGNVVSRYFEASNSFATAAQRNRTPMFRSDSKQVNVNRKLQVRGHYDDKGFTLTRAAGKREESAK